MSDVHFGKLLFTRVAFLTLGLLSSLSAYSLDLGNADTWDLDPANSVSVEMSPVRETTISRDGLKLALKHFPRRGAQPVLLVHGLAQNDRGWDAAIARYSFARFLHSQGFDVWAGNLRGAGTEGFRSEAPPGPHHWTVDDFAILDLPSLVEKVTSSTGQRPFVVVHSLGAWVTEGYLAGITYDKHGRVVARDRISTQRQQGIRGLISIGGVYNLRWEHPVSQALSNPIRTPVDFYHSNYELELLSRAKPLYHIVPILPSLPLDWIGRSLFLPLDEIPFVGGRLMQLWKNVQSNVIATPIMSMFYYAPNSDGAMVRDHTRDGLEDLAPHLVEQLANTINDRRTSSYYHLKRPADAYDYGSVRKHFDLPLLIIGGGRDRLASAYETYEDGYLQTQARDKQYLYVEEAGHLDIITGIHAPSQVMTPVTKWLREHQ